MKLPFTHDQFLDVFAAYNGALWPVAVLLWVATVWTLVRLARGGAPPRLVGGLLALHWAWAGAAYHIAYFAGINPVARIFGALFVLQALLFAFYGVRRADVAVTWGRRPHQVLSIVFSV